jgi:hypothetical protein
VAELPFDHDQRHTFSGHLHGMRSEALALAESDLDRRLRGVIVVLWRAGLQGFRYPPDPPTVEELIAVMRTVGDDPDGVSQLVRRESAALSFACFADQPGGAGSITQLGPDPGG